MCNKAADTSASAIQFVPEFYKTHEMCDKAVDTCLFVYGSFPDQYNIEEICVKVGFSKHLYPKIMP